MKRIAYLLLILVLLAGCKSSKHTTSKLPVETKTTSSLSSKMQLSIPGSSMTINGTMKLKEDERIQLTVLMPFFRTELLRIELTPTDVLIIDRSNKQYAQTTTADLSAMSPNNISYGQVEKLLIEASKSNGKAELTTTDLGLPYVAGAKVVLSDFSDSAFDLPATTVSDKYKQVSLSDLINSYLGQ